MTRKKFTSPSNFSYLIFAKDTHWREDNIFKELCWKSWMSACRRRKLDPFTLLYTKIQFYQRLQHKTRNSETSRENMGSALQHTEIEKDCLTGLQFFRIQPTTDK